MKRNFYKGSGTTSSFNIPDAPVRNLPKARKTHKIVDSYEFTKVWMTSQTLDDVCERLEMTKQQAYSKANTLRKRGVKLPRMSRRLDKNSTEELNKLVERYAK